MAVQLVNRLLQTLSAIEIKLTEMQENLGSKKL